MVPLPTVSATNPTFPWESGLYSCVHLRKTSKGGSQSSATMGSCWPTGFVPKPALAVKWGLGIPKRRSIWPEAVWESPTTPCRKGACAHREFSQTKHKAGDSVLLLDSSACLPVGCWVTNPRVGGANPANPLNFSPAQSEGREVQEHLRVSPGGTTYTWERLKSQLSSVDM